MIMFLHYLIMGMAIGAGAAVGCVLMCIVIDWLHRLLAGEH